MPLNNFFRLLRKHPLNPNKFISSPHMLNDKTFIPAFNEVDEILLQDVVKQAEKDIALAGLSYTFKSDTTEHLIEEMAQFLNQLSVRQLNSLVYTIDVDPKQSAPITSLALALAVWNRVFKKVWFRKSFKTGNK